MSAIHLGYEIGSGDPVGISPSHQEIDQVYNHVVTELL